MSNRTKKVVLDASHDSFEVGALRKSRPTHKISLGLNPLEEHEILGKTPGFYRNVLFSRFCSGYFPPKFSKNSGKNEVSTLTNFIFRSTRRIFLIFFYGSKWIFEADRTSLSEIASESTGKRYLAKPAGGKISRTLSGPQ